MLGPCDAIEAPHITPINDGDGAGERVVEQADPSDGTRAHALDRIAARLPHASRPGVARSTTTWSAELKDRLYRRMFPDAPPPVATGAGTTSDVPAPAMP